MSGKRPDISIRLKKKDDKTTEYVLAGWSEEGKDAVSLKLSTGWRLVGPDNEEYTTGREGNVYLDLYQNSDSRQQAPRGGRPPQGRGQGGSRDFPGRQPKDGRYRITDDSDEPWGDERD